MTESENHLWVRAEQRAFEKRVALTPQGAKALMDAGFLVTVEDSGGRAIPISAYKDVGCEIAAADSWVNAPADTIVLGLKELDPDGPDLIHRHIMFGHAFKGQADGAALLARFERGGGVLYDLEYLADENGRRIAAFGYWAGFAGVAVGMKAWIAQQKKEKLGPVGVFKSKEALLQTLNTALAALDAKVVHDFNAIVIGAKGRVGTGAADLLEALGVSATLWDIEETKSGGPFPEILDHTLFVNCILAGPNVPVFLPKSSVDVERKLCVVADVSCDPSSDYNPIPIYQASTTFVEPVINIAGGENPMDVMAIDNLPSMLPTESSEDYAEQLLPYLLRLDRIDQGVWAGAKDVFDRHTS